MSKKKPGKYLQFYARCIKIGSLPDFGLCCSLKSELLYLFIPTEEDEDILRSEGTSVLFWGSGMSSSSSDYKRWHSFTPLRQTVVLFMACLNNEL